MRRDDLRRNVTGRLHTHTHARTHQPGPGLLPSSLLNTPCLLSDKCFNGQPVSAAAVLRFRPTGYAVRRSALSPFAPLLPLLQNPSLPFPRIYTYTQLRDTFHPRRVFHDYNYFFSPRGAEHSESNWIDFQTILNRLIENLSK